MSSSRSASSSTSHARRDVSRDAVLTKWSRRRPGVPVSTEPPFLRRIRAGAGVAGVRAVRWDARGLEASWWAMQRSYALYYTSASGLLTPSLSLSLPHPSPPPLLSHPVPLSISHPSPQPRLLTPLSLPLSPPSPQPRLLLRPVLPPRHARPHHPVEAPQQHSQDIRDLGGQLTGGRNHHRVRAICERGGEGSRALC